MHFLMRVKPLGWFALSIILIISLFLIFMFGNHSSSASRKSYNADVNKQNLALKNFVADEKLSEYPGLQLHTELNGTDTYSISISYPFTNIKEIDEPIKHWISDQKEEFLATIKPIDSSDDVNVRSHLNIQVETTTITEGKYNIVLNAYHYTGGANGSTHIKAFNFDIEKERHLTLGDIFINPNNESFKNKVLSEINQIVSEKDDYSELIDQEILNESIQSIEDIVWGMSANNFTIYYDEYEIGPGALGPVMFNIPIDHMDSFVQRDWLETFEMAEEIAERERQEKEAAEKEKQKKEQVQLEKEQSKPIENDGKYIALTFDDGPHPDVTPRILDALEEYNAKATFFMLGLQVEYYPTLAAQVAQQGHEVANHSYSHSDLTLLGHDKLVKEISTTNANIENITGKKSVLFRPPYGAYNEQVKNIAAQNGLSIILWSVDSLDWKNRDRNTIYSTVTANATVGSTVLLHDIHPTTADALPNVLKTLSEQGYKFVTVSELLNIQGKTGSGPF